MTVTPSNRVGAQSFAQHPPQPEPLVEALGNVLVLGAESHDGPQQPPVAGQMEEVDDDAQPRDEFGPRVARRLERFHIAIAGSAGEFGHLGLEVVASLS